MLKSLLTLLIIVSAWGTIAHAKTMKVPSDESPVASIDIPDNWNPEDMENGATGQSEDKSIDVTVVAWDRKKGADAALNDTFEFLKGMNVLVDQSSKKVNKLKINGLDAEEMLFRAKPESGSDAATSLLSATIIVVSIKDKVILLTHYGETTDEEKHREEIDKMVKSLKPVG